MNKSWRIAFFAFCLISIAVVLVWAGVLGYRWYEAYELEEFIISHVRMEDLPFRGVPRSQWIAETKAFDERRAEVFGRLDKFTGWQQNLVLADAVHAWQACNPRPSYGSAYLWSLLYKHDAKDLMGRMIETPLVAYRKANPNKQQLAESLHRLSGEYRLPLSLLSVDQPLSGGALVPTPQRGLHGELTALASANGLSWKVADQTIILGTEEELAQYTVEAEARRRRVESVDFSSPGSNQTIHEKLDGLVTLVFFSAPLGDVVDFLKDYLGMNIVLLSGDPDASPAPTRPKKDSPVTIFVENVPSTAAIDCLLKQMALKWEVFDEAIAFATPQELDAFDNRIKRRYERLDSLLRSLNHQEQFIYNKLASPVTLEFVETPLKDVNDFLMDYVGVNCLALNARPAENDSVIDQLADKPVTVHVQSVTLGMALDCLAEQNGFDWDVVDGFLCMGEVTAIQSFRRRLSESDHKPAHANEVLIKLLQSPLVTLSPGRETLKTDANGSVYGSVYAKRIEPGEYSAASIVEFFWATMVVYGPPSEFGTPLVCFVRNDIPFHRALDVVCELTGLVWEVQPNGSIRVVEAGK